MPESTAGKCKDDWRVPTQLHGLGDEAMELGMKGEIREANNRKQLIGISGLPSLGCPVTHLMPCPLQVLAHFSLPPAILCVGEKTGYPAKGFSHLQFE